LYTRTDTGWRERPSDKNGAMSTRPLLSVGLPNFGPWMPGGDWRRFLDFGPMVEDAGLDRVVVVDHVVMSNNTHEYRWGKFPTPPDAQWPEPLTLLSGIAARTSRIRLGTGVVLPSLRGATLFAKTTATLDVMCNGRLDLGVGIGWQREEYDAAGLDWDKRGRIFTDVMGAVVELWNNTPASYHSPTVNFDDIYVVPKPVQPGGVPLWFAGTFTPTSLSRMARWASGWIPIMGESIDGVREGARTVKEAMAARGRDPEQLRVQGPLPLMRNDDGSFDLAKSMEHVPALVDAGATAIHLPLHMFAKTMEEAPSVLADIKRRFDASF